MSIALVTLALVWAGFIAYVALGGADFGTGVWDLFIAGPTSRRQHQFISRVLGPVWEANHVWLIFLLVGLMNVFPEAFAAFMSALFIPLTIALLGIVLRGAGFIFRTHAVHTEGLFAHLWTRVFSICSLIAPFFLGISAAAVAGGQIHPSGSTTTDMLFGWLTPFGVAIGVMAVLQCATLAAVYLTAEAHIRHEKDFVASYRRKALVSSALVSVLGVVCLILSASEAPWLWSGLLTHALVFVAGTILTGTLVLVMLFQRRYRLASLFVVLETALMLISWGVSQYPYIIPPVLTIQQAANAPALTAIILAVMVIGMALVLPALFYLFKVFQWTSTASGSQASVPPAPPKA